MLRSSWRGVLTQLKISSRDTDQGLADVDSQAYAGLPGGHPMYALLRNLLRQTGRCSCTAAVVSAGPPTRPASGCRSPTGFAPGVAAERRHR